MRPSPAVFVPATEKGREMASSTNVSIEQIRRDAPPTLDVPAAGKLLGISRSHAYESVRRGEFPATVLRVGGCYRVVTASLLRVLDGGVA